MRIQHSLVAFLTLGLLLASCRKKDCLLSGDCSPNAYQSSYLIEQSVPAPNGESYYIDSEDGSNNNSGLSENDAWETTAPLGETDLQAGDHLYFKRGQMHFGQLWIKNSGTANERIVISSYGSGDMPIVKHSHKKEIAVFLDGADYVTLQNLNIHGGYEAIALAEADYAIIEG